MPKYRSLFPSINPYSDGTLDVGDGHQIYYEQSGNPDGRSAIYLHGGPGAGCNPGQRRVFDADKYRIVLFDQRGCGKSKPTASLENNTTWKLIADMEKLRVHLGIQQWLVCGGSWGSTLAIAYAQSHPSKVAALILRGIFTFRKQELDWFYQGGAAAIFPDEWEKLVAPIPAHQRGDMIAAYYRQLTSDNLDEQRIAARAWSIWEGSTINLMQRPAQIERFGSDDFAVAFARIECHYFKHKGFFETDRWLLDNIDKIRHIPSVIIQGRYDVCTPMITAWDLHKALPTAEFHIIADAGHAFDEPGIIDQLVKATDRFAN